jgi:type III secretion protein C
MKGITVVLSDRTNYAVNGKFSKMDPAEFWTHITKAYSLVWFFDGKIMCVYANAELQTQICRMDADGIGTLSVILSRRGFVASDFSFRDIGEANVPIVTAPPQYINIINDIETKVISSKISDINI